MAAVIRITDLDLPIGITHISTDYQISTDELFSTIVVESLNDTVYLTQIRFDTVLDPTIQYYARTRIRLSTGFTSWGNVDIFTPNDINDIDADKDIPTVVTLPNITLTEDVNNFPLTGFTIALSGFNTLTNATHKSTSYFIDDLYGNNIWRSLNNAINKDSIIVDDVMLIPNKVYRIRVMFHATSNDVSVLSTKTISTKLPVFTKLLSQLSNVDSTQDLTVDLVNITGVTTVDWELYGVGQNASVLLYSTTVTSAPINRVVIPNTVLDSGTFYVLKIKSNLENNYLYEYFRTL